MSGGRWYRVLWTPVLAIALAGGPASAQKAASAALDAKACSEAVWYDVDARLRAAQDAHWHKGEYNHIVALAHAIVAAEPHDISQYADSGWLLWSMNKDNDALAFYKLGVRNNPDTYFLYDEIGMYYWMHKKDAASAVTWYERAATKKDCTAPSLHALAHAYEKSGDLGSAQSTWERAVQRKDDPAHPAAIVNLARVKRLRQDRTPQSP